MASALRIGQSFTSLRQLGTWRVLVRIVEFGLGCIFLVSGLDKARQPYEFLSSVYGYELTGPNIGYWIAFLVPWVEMSCGLGLIIGVWQYGSLLITAVLLGVFALAQARAVSKGLSIPCGCGVVMASNLTYMKVLETAFLSASAFVCLVVEVAQSVRRTRVTY